MLYCKQESNFRIGLIIYSEFKTWLFALEEKKTSCSGGFHWDCLLIVFFRLAQTIPQNPITLFKSRLDCSFIMTARLMHQINLALEIIAHRYECCVDCGNAFRSRSGCCSLAETNRQSEGNRGCIKAHGGPPRWCLPSAPSSEIAFFFFSHVEQWNALHMDFIVNDWPLDYHFSTQC